LKKKDDMDDKNLKGKKSLGPVTNLEEYVHPDWWRYIFNATYLKTDGDVVNDDRITRNELDIFADILNVSEEDKILDLCCGHGRHTIELARMGFKNLTGLDRSHYLIQRAKSTTKKENLTIKFKEGDARKLPFPSDNFDVVLILGNSFGYFETVKDDLRVLKEVFRVLKPWGKILIDVTDGAYLRENYKTHSWEWIDQDHFVCRERALSVDGQRLISREIVSNVNEGVIVDQFYAERLYTGENLVELLKDAGFDEVVIHREISSDSQRNQDLGMMEKRIILTGVVRKEWTPVKRKPSDGVKNIAVVLGDPSKPDSLKPMGVFDDDDIYTIDRMKDALRNFDDYSFSYLENHNSLIKDLSKIKGKIDYVFNLCDEGFENKPRMELHVPALLEILGIPYTGSGPQCLAFCYDKSLVRGIAKEMEIPVPEAMFIKPEDSTFELQINFPVIIKPNLGDSSFGITKDSVVYRIEDLLDGISKVREKFGYDKPILVEEFLTGNDLTVGIIGNPPSSYTVLPIVEEDYSVLPDGLPRISGYEAKWMPDSPYWNIQSIKANLKDKTEKILISNCIKLFERLECQDYARFDWRLDCDGNPKLLEVNPNPGWCWDGHLAKMSKIGNISYQEMLKMILKGAEKRLGLFVEQEIS
jgi:D-alanine-D-alanine ligase